MKTIKKHLYATLSLMRKHKIKTALLLIILVIGILIATRGPKEVKREYVTVAPVTVSQEVDVTGRVEASTEVALGVQSGGKVSSVPVSVGQSVKAGALLVRVNTSDLQVRLARQQAALDKALIVLAREEPKTAAGDSLEKAYEDGFSAVSDAFLDMPVILNGLDSLPDASYLSRNSLSMRYGQKTVGYLDEAERQYDRAEDSYKELLKEYRATSRQSAPEAIEALVERTHASMIILTDAVKAMNTFLDYVESRSDTAIDGMRQDQALIDGYTATVNSRLNELAGGRTAIKNARTGITDENHDIDSIKIDIRQARLDMQDTLVQIGNRSVYAPISGTVTAVDTRVGEIISGGQTVVSLISDRQYQITANIPESEMAKVRVGAEAEVTLDAYGDSAPFKAAVVSVNPAGTLLDGVATYKTTFQFADNDDRIKSGMTADVTVKGERKENVLAVPQRAIVTRDNVKYVQVLVGEEVVEKAVQTGLRGTDGNIEITDGLVAGDKVIVFVPTK